MQVLPLVVLLGCMFMGMAIFWLKFLRVLLEVVGVVMAGPFGGVGRPLVLLVGLQSSAISCCVLLHQVASASAAPLWMQLNVVVVDSYRWKADYRCRGCNIVSSVFEGHVSRLDSSFDSKLDKFYPCFVIHGSWAHMHCHNGCMQ